MWNIFDNIFKEVVGTPILCEKIGSWFSYQGNYICFSLHEQNVDWNDIFLGVEKSIFSFFLLITCSIWGKTISFGNGQLWSVMPVEQKLL